MNFLAHLYLSGSNKDIMIGNFIADHIKGNKFKQYPKNIQKGIFLHREIDSYTDTHPLVKISKRRLHKRYGHYNGVIIDIFYDYFLAKNWHYYSAIPLEVFTQSVYTLLNQKEAILPVKSQQFIKYLIQHNMLYNYQFLSGIEQVLNGVNRRTKGKSQMHLAIEDLQLFTADFENDFNSFFNDLCDFSNKKRIEINQLTL